MLLRGTLNLMGDVLGRLLLMAVGIFFLVASGPLARSAWGQRWSVGGPRTARPSFIALGLVFIAFGIGFFLANP